MFMVFPESCKVYVCERGKEGRKEREREREKERERERERELILSNLSRVLFLNQ